MTHPRRGRRPRLPGAAYRAGLPAPRVDDVVEVEGRHGIILERIEGPSMLRRVVSRPWTILKSARLLADLHVATHARSASDLPPQQGLLERKIRAANGLSDLTRATALDVLARLSNDSAVCHGDFHPDNILMSSRGPIIIDWSYASHGNPLADVVCTSLLIRTADLPPGMTARWPRLLDIGRDVFNYFYLKRYSRLRPVSLQEQAAWQLPAAVASLMEETSDKEETRLLGIIERSL
jgi:aminoglycoside phosphotransferase (APT) family kinase protein